MYGSRKRSTHCRDYRLNSNALKCEMKLYHAKVWQLLPKRPEKSVFCLHNNKKRVFFFFSSTRQTTLGSATEIVAPTPSLIALSFEQRSSFGFCTSELLPFKMLQRVWGFLALVPSMKSVPNLEKRLRIVFKCWQRIARIFEC